MYVYMPMYLEIFYPEKMHWNVSVNLSLRERRCGNGHLRKGLRLRQPEPEPAPQTAINSLDSRPWLFILFPVHTTSSSAATTFFCPFLVIAPPTRSPSHNPTPPGPLPAGIYPCYRNLWLVSISQA